MRTIALLLTALLLCGCPKKTETKSPAPKTGAAKTAAKTTGGGTPIKTGGGAAEGLKPLPKTDDPKVGIKATSLDPVCKMEVSITDPGATHNFGDTAYMFCSKQCADTFKANPKQYLRKD